VAERYLASYHETMDRLGIGRPDIEPKATEHVDTTPDQCGFGSMLDLISKLLTQGAAYEAKGDVYFAVRKFAGYGKLSNRTLDELQAGARVEPGEGKQNPLDFALWKSAKPGEPQWNSPWGPGRPGWHIECSAMSTTYLGDQFDIHGGGVDLVFPHHENEIAQAQAAGKPFARVWVHNGLLTVNGEKMSKSLGNYTTVEDALRTCEGKPDALKVFFLGAHYRSPIDYSPAAVKAALGRLKRWVHFIHFANNRRPAGTAAGQQAAAWDREFAAAMAEDLNTPNALAVLDAAVSAGYQSDGQRWPAAEWLLRAGATLGLFSQVSPRALTPDQLKRLEEREAARRKKDFAVSDRIRDEFRAAGLAIEDTPEGWAVVPAS
jgi:cysteinyl-tRNA synthetase